MGHLIRSLTLARQLSSSFRVVFLNGGRLPDSIPVPESIELVNLPPLGMRSDGKLIHWQADQTLEQIKILRKQRIQSTIDNVAPDVVLIELFPFGRKKFAFELLPLLRQVNRCQPKPVVVCSVRDILVTQRDDQQHFDDRARWLVDRYFDAVLVHSDPHFMSLHDSFKPRHILKTPVFHTGFVSPEPQKPATQVIPENSFQQHIVVSAGGGIVGTRLFRCMIAAYPLIQQQRKIPITLVAGPFLPERDWQFLQYQSQKLTDLTVHRSVPDLRALLSNASVSISQCGYNTAMDLLHTGIPSLVVPFSEGGENEQPRRADKLADLGTVKVLAEHELNAAILARHSLELLDFKPSAIKLSLNGAENSKTIIKTLLNRTVLNGSTGEQHHDSVA
jgi:predicted glycosyltransferase